ncbi:MAG TPA: DUF3667 domain-containing protein [Longimicrobiaceae bacterium]
MATLESPASPTTIAAGVPIADVAACPSCGAAMQGDYCPKCGERRLEEEHFSFRHFVREAGEEVFDLDSRALRSLRLLLFSPGTLTLEHLGGRRRRYLGPMRLFLAVFALVLFTGTLVPRDDSARRKQREDAVDAFVTQLVHNLAVRHGITDAAARDQLTDAAMQAESWLGVSIPLLFAVVLYACFRRRRRWYGEHLVFATHFATFNYAVGLVGILLAVVRPGMAVTVALACLTWVAMLYYLAVAVRRVYGGGRGAAAAWALALIIGFGIVQAVIGLLSIGIGVARMEWF